MKNEILLGIDKLPWQSGIALSPYEGFGDMRNVDISIWPGVVKLAFASTKKSGTTIDAQPMWFAQDIDANQTVYCLASNGKLFKASNAAADNWQTWSQVTGNTVTNAHGNGLAVWHDYVFVARDTNLDVYSISGNTWTSAWQTLKSDSTGIGYDLHPMVVGTNDVLYIAEGADTTNKLGPTINSLLQKTSKIFDPADATTYTYTANAVGANLIYGYHPSTLVQFINDICMGTYVGTSRSSCQKIADIFPWDRFSSGYGQPIRIRQYGINQMLTINNVLYIQAGNQGNFFVSNGASAHPLFTFPRNTTGSGSPYRSALTYPAGLMIHKNRLFFGINTSTSGSEVGASGVYSVNLDGTGLVLENIISTGSTAGNAAPAALFAVNNGSSAEDYLIGWSDTSAQGVDLVGENNFVTSYGATIDSPVFILGSALVPNSLQQLEIYLDRPLAANEGVKILQRTSLATLWSAATTLATFDFATYGALQKYNFPIGGLTTGEMVQFQIQLTGTTTSPTLRYVRIL